MFKLNHPSVFLSLIIILVVLSGCTGAPIPITSSQAAPTPGSPNQPTTQPAAPSVIPITPAVPAAPSAAPTVSGAPQVSTPEGVGTSGPATAEATPLVPPEPTGLATQPGGGLVITRANAGQTINLHVGDRFVMSLGEGYDWTVISSNPAVVSRVVNITPIRGSQGVYEAHQVGSTTLNATGDPPCRSSKPACALPSVAFEFQIVVQ